MINNNKIYFIHANGYPSDAYLSLFAKIKKTNVINNFNLVSNNIDIKNLKNWDPFHKNFIKSIDPDCFVAKNPPSRNIPGV